MAKALDCRDDYDKADDDKEEEKKEEIYDGRLRGVEDNRVKESEEQ